MGVAGSKPQPDSQPTLSAGYEGLDFYEILCISRDATDEDIKRAYYRRAKSTHPDKDSTPGAKERFQKLNEAYETLKTPETRAMYDFKLKNDSELKEDSEAETETETDSRRFDPKSTMPGQWGAQETPSPHTPGWFEWLFAGFRSPSQFTRYEPAAYVDRHKHLPLTQGLSAKEIYEHLNFCIQNATWQENGRDPSLCTLLRNLFECIAYDEKRWGCNQTIPDFGCMHSLWCREDEYEQHYAQDFYAFWLNFDTLKTFEWVNPYYTHLDDPALLRKVEKENKKVHKAMKDQYNDIIRTIVELLLSGDPRLVTHIVMNHFKGGPRLTTEEFCFRFIRQCRHGGKATREDSAHPRGPTRNQRKKQKQRNKAKKKNSW